MKRSLIDTRTVELICLSRRWTECVGNERGNEWTICNRYFDFLWNRVAFKANHSADRFHARTSRLTSLDFITVSPDPALSVPWCRVRVRNTMIKKRSARAEKGIRRRDSVGRSDDRVMRIDCSIAFNRLSIAAR